MIIVSGCPRSGTSLMMDLMRKTFGEGRIIGEKFPQEKKVKNKRRKNDTDETFEYRNRMSNGAEKKAQEQLEVSKDLNPNGFWECPFTVRGARFRKGNADLLKKIEKEETPSICKIVSQGLGDTDPRYVTKVIYMLREPTAVAKSQERLRRELRYKAPNGQVRNLWDSMGKISPKMFIEVTIKAAEWLKAHPEIEVHYVEYSKLMSDPEQTLLGIQGFLGEGDFAEAISTIDPELNRSSNVTIVHPLLVEAEMIYEALKSKDWDAIEAYSTDRKTLLNRQTSQWTCARSGSIAQEGICRGCIDDPKFRESLKKNAEGNGVDWKSMPCAFECGFDVDRESYLSLEESVENNHWSTE